MKGRLKRTLLLTNFNNHFEWLFLPMDGNLTTEELILALEEENREDERINEKIREIIKETEAVNAVLEEAVKIEINKSERCGYINQML